MNSPDVVSLKWRWLVFAALALLCLYKVGSLPLFETDEGFAANRAASFERHGTWRLSFDDVGTDAPQFRKPPLLYWTVAILYRAIGYNEWAVRLPTALAGLAALWLLFRMHRRAFDEFTALSAVILFAVVPFIIWHIRTAMLEMPVLACSLAAIYFLAYRAPSIGASVLAGLSGGAVVLIKGSPGFLALALAIISAFVHRGFHRRVLVDMAIFLLIALALFGLYVWSVPAEFRDPMLQGMFVSEGKRRFVERQIAERWRQAFGLSIWTAAWPLVALAPLGLVALARRLISSADARRWAIQALLIAGPVAYGGVHQVVPYPRYFIPVYPWLAALAALGVATFLRRALALPVLAFAGALVFFSPTARDMNIKRVEISLPGLEDVARHIPDYVPRGEKVIFLSRRNKCHQLLFYGRRGVTAFEKWIGSELTNGSTNYIVALAGLWRDSSPLPAETLAESQGIRLLRVRVAIDRPDVVGAQFCKPDNREELLESQRALGRRVEPFDQGILFLVNNPASG